MKTIVLLLVFLLSFNFVEAQYRSYKDDYNFRTYTFEKTDKYNPTAAGLLAIIPGAGHCYNGEAGRGLAFIGGMVGSFGVAAVGFALLPWDESDRSEVPGFVIGAIGWVGFATFYVWSIIDAVHVAKIKNLAIINNNISLEVLPNFEISNIAHQSVNNFGVSLLLKF
jgi:hypothetical protein